VVRKRLQQDRLLVEAQCLEDGFQALSVERESNHVEFRLSDRVQRSDQGRGAIGLYAQYRLRSPGISRIR
jgi:hypothetical protein